LYNIDYYMHQKHIIEQIDLHKLSITINNCSIYRTNQTIWYNWYRWYIFMIGIGGIFSDTLWVVETFRWVSRLPRGYKLRLRLNNFCYVGTHNRDFLRPRTPRQTKAIGISGKTHNFIFLWVQPTDLRQCSAYTRWLQKHSYSLQKNQPVSLS